MASRYSGPPPTDIRTNIRKTLKREDRVVPQGEPGLPMHPIAHYPHVPPSLKGGEPFKSKGNKGLARKGNVPFKGEIKGKSRKGNVQYKGSTAVRKVKPKKSQIGSQKGDWRKVGKLWKQRRFTIQQRREFRSRDKVFGGPDDGRPTTKK